LGGERKGRSEPGSGGDCKNLGNVRSEMGRGGSTKKGFTLKMNFCSKEDSKKEQKKRGGGEFIRIKP